jgi:SAM-dependent methyltransferase
MKSQQLYNKYNASRHWENHPTVYAEHFAKFLKDKNFKGLILDVGCGNGRDVNIFHGFGFDTLGVDNSEKEIESAKEKFPELKFEVQDAEKLNFKDNSIGAVFMINIIHYVHKEKAIQEILRTLTSGGYLFIHFNIDVIDQEGNVDYHHEPEDILKLISKFKVSQKRVFERIDSQPMKHKHEIMELILQKI